MWDIAIQAGIGLAAGLMGGMMGVGGSIVIIPGLIIYLSFTSGGYRGVDQHLIQSAAMICNVFIAAPAALAHRRAGAIMRPVVVRLVPAALLGIVLGVALSNSDYFARDKGRYLALILAGFLVYVAGYNAWRLFSRVSLTERFKESDSPPGWKVIALGVPMGFAAGLLGIGGGALCVPGQQLILRLPLRRAIANSAVTIMCIAWMGAIYKNFTLLEHGVSMVTSLQLAGMLIPTAMVGSYIGGRLTHALPRRVLRVVFIVFMLLVAYATFNRARPGRIIKSESQTTRVD